MKWIISGLLLASTFTTLALLSFSFSREIPLSQRPIILMTGLLILAGLIYLFLAADIARTPAVKQMIIWILLTGALMRGLMLFSTPILEDDYFRYLWDGAVTANGFNPYAYSPVEIREGSDHSSEIPPNLTALSRASGNVIAQINHSNLRTIYPPVTQAMFALAHWISPWSMAAWRFILLLFDISTLLILLYILQYLKLSPLWIGIYWLNPLLVKEIFNSGHMDILVFPFLLGAILFSLRKRHLRAVSALAFAVGVKIWPVVLLPIILRPLFPNFKRISAALGWFGFLCGVIFLPVFLSGLDPNSGYNAYSQRWELNDTIFKVLVALSASGLKIFGIHPGHGQFAGRVLTAAILLFWIAYITFHKTEHPRRIFDQCLLIIAAIFLLSPTQFPWYSVWLIPFLVVSPRKPLLWLTALVPLYYLRYYFLAVENVELFDHYIVWIEFGPIWILILREWYLNRKTNVITPSEVAANHEK